MAWSSQPDVPTAPGAISTSANMRVHEATATPRGLAARRRRRNRSHSQPAGASPPRRRTNHALARVRRPEGAIRVHPGESITKGRWWARRRQINVGIMADNPPGSLRVHRLLRLQADLADAAGAVDLEPLIQTVFLAVMGSRGGDRVGKGPHEPGDPSLPLSDQLLSALTASRLRSKASLESPVRPGEREHPSTICHRSGPSRLPGCAGVVWLGMPPSDHLPAHVDPAEVHVAKEAAEIVSLPGSRELDAHNLPPYEVPERLGRLRPVGLPSLGGVDPVQPDVGLFPVVDDDERVAVDDPFYRELAG